MWGSVWGPGSIHVQRGGAADTTYTEWTSAAGSTHSSEIRYNVNNEKIMDTRSLRDVQNQQSEKFGNWVNETKI